MDIKALHEQIADITDILDNARAVKGDRIADIVIVGLAVVQLARLGERALADRPDERAAFLLLLDALAATVNKALAITKDELPDLQALTACVMDRIDKHRQSK